MEHSNDTHAKTLASKTLSRIECEQISPRSKWHFWLTEKTFWLFVVLSIVCASLSVAGVIYVMMNTGWEFQVATNESFVELLFSALPYLWFILVVVFAGLGYYNFHHTNKGYRYSFSAVVFFASCLSVALGIGFYLFGLGQIVDEEIGGRVPFHESALAGEHGRWNQPRRGLLGGEVIHIEDNGDFLLRTYGGIELHINGESLSENDFEVLASNSEVRVVGVPFLTGDVSPDGEFHACFVFPMEVVGRPAWGMPQPRHATATRPASSQNERNISVVRSNECMDVRPYETLQRVRNIKQ